MSDLDPTTIQTDRLLLTPLEVGDAAAMIDVLADADLYEFTGGEPPSIAQLQARYAGQVAGSGNANEIWLNWIVRLTAEAAQPIGFVQATVTVDAVAHSSPSSSRSAIADVAWVIGTAWQRRGFAREAAVALCAWLIDSGVGRLEAHIHPDHSASAAVARACGMEPTGAIDSEGEHVWARVADR